MRLLCVLRSAPIAAQMLGRHYISIEREPEYVKIAEQRLAAVQPTLIAAE